MSRKKDDFGNRMKCYENVTRNYLTRRTPVIIRLDGVAWHTFTKGFDRPFDHILNRTMRAVTEKLCKEVQNCVFGYTQSDEISLVLIDYYNLNTDVWFGNNIQKMVSVIAAKASVYFNSILKEEIEKSEIVTKIHNDNTLTAAQSYYISILKTKIGKAFFDARVFNIPKEEVTNYFIWRQKDCQINSINSVAQTLYPEKMLEKKSSKERIDMINEIMSYDEIYPYYKFGTIVIKNENKWCQVSISFIENRDMFDDLVFNGYEKGENYEDNN